MAKTDVVVIGGGINGLTASCYLAKVGKSVVLVEKRESLGGLASVSEFHPGFFAPIGWDETALLSENVISDLELSRHGVEFETDSYSFNFKYEDTWIEINKEKGLSFQNSNEKLNDIQNDYLKFRSFFGPTSSIFRELVESPPLDILSFKLSSMLEAAPSALKLRMLGSQKMKYLLKVAPMCAADFLNEFFSDSVVSGHLCAPALWSGRYGPWAPLTTFNLLLWESLSRRRIRGGVKELIAGLEKRALQLGVDIRTSTEAESLNIENSKIQGVNVESSGVKNLIETQKVLSTFDPKSTFSKLVPVECMTLNLENNVKNYRSKGTSAKINFALSEKLNLPFERKEGIQNIRLYGDLDFVEKASDAIKYGEFSENPVIDLYIYDKSYSPEGKSVLSAMVHFVPLKLKKGWTQESKNKLVNNVKRRIEAALPGFEKSIEGFDVLIPIDFESKLGISGGHLYHGELAIDQFLPRPFPEARNYRTPIEGLYLGGSGAYPGGGITGLPGKLCSRQIIKDS